MNIVYRTLAISAVFFPLAVNAEQAVWKFDFGLKVLDAPDGFIKVTQDMLYEKGRGWGFEKKLGWGGRSFPYSPTAALKHLDAISRDGVRVVGNFVLDVPDGQHLVWTLVGDLGVYDLTPMWDQHSYNLKIEDTQIRRGIPFDRELFIKEYFKDMNRDYRRGEDVYDHYLVPLFDDETHEIEVRDGQLTVSAGRANICALVVYPAKRKTEFEKEVSRLRKARRDYFYSFVKVREPEFEGQAAPVTATEKERGYRIWPRHKMMKVTPQTQPEPDELTGAMKAIAAQGQQETVTFVVRPFGDLRGAEINISDLVSDAGAKIASESIRVRNLYYRVTPNGKVGRSHLPPFKKCDLQKEVSKQFWLTFKIPDTAPAGIYIGKVIFKPESHPPAELAIKVKVLGFRLADHYPYAQFHLQSSNPARYTYQQSWHFPGEYVPAMKIVFEHLKGLGLLPQISDIIAKTAGLGTPGAKVEPSQKDVRRFEQIVDEHKRIFPGVPPVISLHRFFGGYFTPRKRRPNGWISSEQPDEYWALMKKYLSIFSELRKKHPDWPPFRYVCGAEMSNGGQDHVLYGKKFLELVRATPGMESIACPNGIFEARTMAKIADIIAPNYSVPMTDAAFRGIPNEKTKLWVYQAFNRFCYGYYMAKVKATGSFKEFYNTSNQRPYNSFDGNDLFVNCALATPDGMVSMPNIEEFSWGIIDYRYIKTLEETMARGRKNEKAHTAVKEAEEFFAELFEEVNPDLEYYLDQAGWWDETVYDIYRWMIAEKILKIRAALGETK